MANCGASKWIYHWSVWSICWQGKRQGNVQFNKSEREVLEQTLRHWSRWWISGAQRSEEAAKTTKFATTSSCCFGECIHSIQEEETEHRTAYCATKRMES